MKISRLRIFSALFLALMPFSAQAAGSCSTTALCLKGTASCSASADKSGGAWCGIENSNKYYSCIKSTAKKDFTGSPVEAKETSFVCCTADGQAFHTESIDIALKSCAAPEQK
jgi:hypothetical protein